MRKKLLFSILSKLIFFITLIFFVVVIVKLPESITSYDTENSIKIGSTGLNLEISKFKNEVTEYITTLLSGSFGTTSKRKPVWHSIKYGFSKTIVLLISSIIISIVLGIIKGVFDSKKDKKSTSSIKLLSTITFLSMPDIFIIIIFQATIVWLFKNGIKFLPVAGSSSFKHSILPILTLSFVPTTYIARITALSFDRIYEQEYIKTALGKGASKFRVIWFHVFRNALPEIIGAFSSITTMLISSLLLIEYMYAYPGLAHIMYTNYKIKESEVVIGTAIIIGLIYFLLDLLFKILKYSLNPNSRNSL